MDFDYEEALRRAVDYWTPEKIDSTVPLDDDINLLFDDDEGSGMLAPTGIFDRNYHAPNSGVETPDPLKKLKDKKPEQQPARPPAKKVLPEQLQSTPRYQSIGKICVQQDDPDKPGVHVTAFYIGPPPNTGQGDVPKDSTGLPPTRYRVLTVAHLFDVNEDAKAALAKTLAKPLAKAFEFAKSLITKPAKPLVFITSSKEIYVIDLKCLTLHPSYKPYDKTLSKPVLDVQNDLCVLHVHPNGSKSKSKDPDPDGKKSESEDPDPDGKKSESKGQCSIKELTPLKLIADAALQCSTVFEVIGYPKSTHKFEGEMTEIPAKYLKVDTTKSTIEIDNHSPKGMSGGPWMIEGRTKNHVYGIQSGNIYRDNKQTNATSPLFREELLKPLGLEYESNQVT